MIEYNELVKSITFFLDLGHNAWDYKLDIYKNDKNQYFSALSKKQVFDLILVTTNEDVRVSESFWIDDSDFNIDENHFFASVEDCINSSLEIISKQAKEFTYYSNE
ncbi:MAG: hypothetical protein GKC53_05365 [Neisseriaceae bacterium]|nr:MAG: hypothetical protein GKC53_05365 [Neisseriaceae bacterium]